MKKIFFGIIVLVIFFLSACKKDKTPNVAPPTSAADTAGYFRFQEQTFMSSAHTTTGSLILFGNKASNPDTLMYYFRNFKTDNGPDLNVYVSQELNPVNYTDIGDLKATTGNFFYKVKATPSIQNSGYVIVWCVDFSVNFGYAQLTF
ncbi:MAG: DM13 domain-containing protein [Chitinophagales bacterium]|jgi:hypothetical protein|nr:DM13 domain-containing protein [Saprospirales bacterium]MBP6661274.1 DM13 domain-containing protein [Chitinophagales bacterium]